MKWLHSQVSQTAKHRILVWVIRLPLLETLTNEKGEIDHFQNFQNSENHEILALKK